MLDAQFQKTIEQLADHEKRIRVLESGEVKNPVRNGSADRNKKIPKGNSEDLFPPIQKLFDSGFFKEWQTDLDVCNALTVRLLTKRKPLRASVVNVLRAMVKKDLLVRDKVQKNKRKVFAYKQP